MIIAGLDLETTGLSQPDGHRIIEVALIFQELETGAEKGRYVRRINPQRPIDPKAQAVHGISFEALASCPTWEQIGPQVSALLSKVDLVIAHNGEGFDIPFLNGELARIGERVYSGAVLDTMLDGRWATPMGKFPNLGELCFATGTDYDPAAAHAADYDVDVMLAAFRRAHSKGFFQLDSKQRRAA